MKTTPCGNSLIHILLIFFSLQRCCRLYNPSMIFVTNDVYNPWSLKNCPAYCGYCLGIYFVFRNGTFFHLILFKYTPSIIVHFLKLFLMILKTILFSVAPTWIVPCSDKLTNCDEYPPDVCTNENYRFLRKDNCRKSLEYVQVSDTWLWA